jgi:biopolymer transport protein ExbD
VRRLGALTLLLAFGAPTHAAEPVSITPACDPNGNLIGLTMDGKTIDLPKADNLDRATRDYLRKAVGAEQKRGVRIEGNGDMPYRCIGGLIFTLQRAGIARISFIAEPPPAEGVQ